MAFVEWISQRRSVRGTGLIGAALLLVGVLWLKVELKIEAVGTVFARHEVMVFATQGGSVAALKVENAQRVRSGQLVVELRNRELELQALHLQREIVETEAAIKRTEIDLREIRVRPGAPEELTAGSRAALLERIVALQKEVERSYSRGYEQAVIPELELRKQEMETLRSRIELLVTSMQAEWLGAGLSKLPADRLKAEGVRLKRLRQLQRDELDLVRKDLAAMAVRAPIDGRVVSLQVRFEGEGVQKGAELLKIAPENDALMVRTMVPERNIDLLRVGMPALMESRVFNSLLEGTVEGRVVRVSPESGRPARAGEEPKGDGKYEVDLEVSASPYPLVLGSSLELKILVGRRSLYELLLRSATSLRRNPRSSPND